MIEAPEPDYPSFDEAEARLRAFVRGQGLTDRFVHVMTDDLIVLDSHVRWIVVSGFSRKNIEAGGAHASSAFVFAKVSLPCSQTWWWRWTPSASRRARGIPLDAHRNEHGGRRNRQGSSHQWL